MDAQSFKTGDYVTLPYLTSVKDDQGQVVNVGQITHIKVTYTVELENGYHLDVHDPDKMTKRDLSQGDK